MRLYYFFCCSIFLVIGQNTTLAQDTISTNKKFSVSGYINGMQSAIFQNINKDWMIENLFHNRLNFEFNPYKNLTTKIELRNRLIYGDNIRNNPITTKQYNTEKGVADLTENIANGQTYILNSSVDRAYIDYTIGNLQLKAGRQRINWGQTFVWNPNDIFNTYSFFDFDYPERPGSDGLRIQYYTGTAGSIEVAATSDSSKKLTTATLFRFNKWQYDFQILAGILNENDYVAGFGWSGNIGKISFRGESSYFHPTKNSNDTTGIYSIAIGFGYTFNNSMSIQTEMLYNQLPNTKYITSLNQFYALPLSAKTLSFTEYNFFMQSSYPITPLLNASVSGIYYPDFNGFYIGPSLEYSLQDNLDISLFLQTFNGKISVNQENINKKEQINFNLAFLRLKYSF